MPLWPLVVYFIAVLAVAGGMLGLSYILGQRHDEEATGEPYESGILPTGSARLRFDVRYYLFAMFFVILDLEAVFIFAWAVAMRKVGWPGYIGILVFVITLLAALLYLWREGALSWSTSRARSVRPGKE